MNYHQAHIITSATSNDGRYGIGCGKGYGYYNGDGVGDGIHYTIQKSAVKENDVERDGDGWGSGEPFALQGRGGGY